MADTTISSHPAFLDHLPLGLGPLRRERACDEFAVTREQLAALKDKRFHPYESP